MAVGDLHAAAVEYLAACVAALNALTTAGAPERSYVSQGPPAYDCCPLLTVHVGGAQIASTHVGTGALATGHRIVQAGVVNQVPLTATILRCASGLNNNRAPSPATLQAEASASNDDLWAIWNWVRARKADNSLFPGECREFEFRNAVAVAVEGLCGGWLIPVLVTVDGFNP